MPCETSEAFSFHVGRSCSACEPMMPGAHEMFSVKVPATVADRPLPDESARRAVALGPSKVQCRMGPDGAEDEARSAKTPVRTKVQPEMKMGKVGALEVRIVEARDCPCAFCTIACELSEYTTTPKKKNEANPQFDQTFFIPINRPNGVLTVYTWRKKLLGADKPNGYFAISLNQIARAPHPKKEPEWYSLVEVQKKILKAGASGTDFVAGGVVEDEGEGAPAEGQAGSEPEKSPRPAGEEVGKIRLQLFLHTPEPEKPKLKGIILDGEWKQGLNAGQILANPCWYENPQYLLTVSSKREVVISLLMPDEKAEPATFYVVKYDDAFYKGRRKTVLNVEDIVPLEGDYLCPPTGPRPEYKYTLSEGMYCVIPCSSVKANNETGLPRYNGKYQIAAFCDRQECISLVPLPTDASLSWSEQRIKGSWTPETSGGADVGGTMWTKNPQFLLTLTQRTDLAVVLNQATAKQSIGLYVIRVQDTKHKAVCYTDEVAATSKCSFSNSTGTTVSGLTAGTYVVMPVTFESQQSGEFELVIYTMSPDTRMAPLVNEWPHKRTVKGRWKGETAGGSPNHKTFVNNPQFELTLSPKSADERAFSIQLVQSRTKRSPCDLGSIGIVVLKNIKGEKAVASDLQKENLVCQTEGWAPVRAIGVNGMLPEEPAKLHAVIIPSTMEPDQEFKFSLTVLSEAKLSLESLDDEEEADA
eukprot:m51a1_g12482 putative calpain-like cysteine protease (700) ;mRNA; r:902-4315